MSLSLNPEQNNFYKYSKKPLFFVILVILIVIAIFIGKDLKKPKISQNLTINYYLELDVNNYNKFSNPWLENNPDRQKLLDLWNQYLEKIVIKPPKNLFNGQVSIIGVSAFFDKIKDYQETGQTQNKQENEIFFRASIASEQIALNYLKQLGSSQNNQELEINVITFKNPILGRNKYYYRIKDKQITLSSNANLINLQENNLKFPEKGFSDTLSLDNKFLKIYIKSPENSFLSQFILKAKEPSWLSAELSPDKLAITFENNQETELIPKSWIDYIPDSQFLAIFSQNIKDTVLNNQLSSLINIQQKEILSLTENSQSLLILKPKNLDFTLKSADFNYSIVILNSNNLTQDSQEIKKILNSIKKVFANKFPSEKITYLPDNSTITELISNPEIFDFQEKILSYQNIDKTASISLKYLQKPNLEFAYAFFEDKLFFSNSVDLLEQTIIQEKHKNTELLLFDCLNNESIPSELIIFNSDPVLQEKYGIKQAIITNKRACVY